MTELYFKPGSHNKCASVVLFYKVSELRKLGFPGSSVVKNLPAMPEKQGQFLGWKDPLEKEIATYSNILA